MPSHRRWSRRSSCAIMTRRRAHQAGRWRVCEASGISRADSAGGPRWGMNIWARALTNTAKGRACVRCLAEEFSFNEGGRRCTAG